MKTSRIILVIGIAHFALWWLSDTIVHATGYNPFMPSDSSAVGYAAFGVQSVLTFPFILDSVYSVVQHLPTFLFVALDRFVWAVCLGALIFGFRRIYHSYTPTSRGSQYPPPLEF